MQSRENIFISGTHNVRRYLDAPGRAYLDGINGIDLKSLMGKTEEISRLKTHLPKPSIMVSIGVGQGEEIHAIDMLYNGSVEKIIGIDLSQFALQAARERSVINSIPAEFVLGSATDLPLAKESVDGIVLSSLMHEVFSYSRNGKQAWNKAIQESTLALKEDGCILLRDSAAPELQGNIQLQFKTNLAREFYDYFRDGYRRFDGWEDLGEELGFNLPIFPQREELDTLSLSPGQAAELLFHFVNFQMGYSEDRIVNRNKRWKELNETYYLPKDVNSIESLRTEEYVTEVLDQGNKALEGTSFQLVCVEKGISVRPRMSKPILENFLLALPGEVGISSKQNVELVSEFVNKMELVFKKIRRAN